MMDLQAHRAVIFDLDGTLVESEPAWAAAKVAVLARHGRSVSEDLLDRYVGQGLAGFLAEVFGPGLSADLRRRLGDEIGVEADRLLPLHREVIPGAARFLRHVAEAGLRVAVCSSSPRRHIDAALDQLGVADAVEVTVSAADLPRGKPHPLPYLETLTRLGLAPEGAVAVEDAPAGFQSAQGAGLAVIGIGPRAMVPAVAEGLALAVPDYQTLTARVRFPSRIGC